MEVLQVLRKHIASLLILVVLTAACRTAHAALQLTVQSGDSSMTFTDGGAGDSAPETGILSVSYALGSWFFSSTIVASSPVIGSPTQALLDLASLNISSSAPGTLTIQATDTGYNLPTSGMISLSGLIAGATSGSVSYRSYVDTSNTAFGTENLIGEVASYGGAFAGTVSGSIAYTSPNPFSLTTEVGITHSSGGLQVTTFNAIGTAVVPEPGVVGLLGLGLGMVGLASLRSRRKRV
jgi:hypothetical protein